MISKEEAERARINNVECQGLLLAAAEACEEMMLESKACENSIAGGGRLRPYLHPLSKRMYDVDVAIHKLRANLEGWA